MYKIKIICRENGGESFWSFRYGFYVTYMCGIERTSPDSAAPQYDNAITPSSPLTLFHLYTYIDIHI